MATFQVSNQVQLDAAISKVKGGDIVVLAAGNYSSLGLVNKLFTSTVTFTSASATSPANVAFAKAYGSSNIVFKNLKIGRTLDPAVDKEWTNISQVENSTNVTFDNVKFYSAGCNTAFMGRGLFVRGGTNVTVKNSDFSHLAVGMTTMSMSGINVQSNKFHDIRIDGMELTAVTGGQIDGNDFRDFRSSATAHPDAIQIWTSGTAKPTTDFTISNNVILPGTGAGAQGIFIQDEVGTAPHERITIRNNLLLDAGNYYNGITVRGGKSITVENNTSVSPTGDTKNFWIRLDNVQGAVVKGNLADQMLQSNSTNLSMSGNIFLNEQKGYVSEISGLNLGASATVSSLIVPGVGYQVPSTSTMTALSSSTTLVADTTSTTTLAAPTTTSAPTTTTSTTTSITSFTSPTLSDTLTPIATTTTTPTTSLSSTISEPQPSAPLTTTFTAPTSSKSTLFSAMKAHRKSLSYGI